MKPLLFHLVVALCSVGLPACIVSTEPMKGETGEPADAETLSALQKQIDDLKAKVDTLEAQAAHPDCPSGYTMAAKPLYPNNVDSVLCTNEDDEVVRVGANGSVFWIDRYEASIWNDGVQYFANQDDSATGSTFSKNGETSKPWLARSVPSVTPSRFVTWFQARAACRAAGKRLPGREEWLSAERGTGDPDVNDGTANTKCNTKSSKSSPRTTNNAGDPTNTPITEGCFSDWGAEDMIGNVWEWTDEWYASIQHLALVSGPEEAPTDSLVPWLDNSLYRDDATTGILSGAHDGDGQTFSFGLPSSAFRGGDWGAGAGAGAFAVNVKNGPSHWHFQVGFRCVMSR